MADDKQFTGASDTTDNLVSALDHCLEGAKTYDKYLADAEQEGDQDLIAFFREASEQEKQHGEKAKRLLAARLNKSGCC